MVQEHGNTMRGARITLRSPGGSTSERRALEECVAIGFPALAHALGRAFTRLPPGSRLRRLIVTRRIQQTYAAANRRDYDSVLAGWAPDSEYRPSRDLMPPDLDPVFHGHDGMHQLWRYWRDAFEDIRWHPEEILDFGDKILVTAQQTGHGSGSGVAVSQPVFQLFTLRAGLVLKQEDFLDRSEALEAARLGE